jgi:hypothetical protein
LTTWYARVGVLFSQPPGVKWTSLDIPCDQWLRIISGDAPVHFNMLTAELLVNGLPLAHLPKVQDADIGMEDAEPRAEGVGAGVDVEMAEDEDSLFVH